MSQLVLPPKEEMLNAFLTKNADYEGLFFTAVKTTGIFCRPTCNARKPKPENVEFFKTQKDALFAGYRACQLCKPMQTFGKTPEWVANLMRKLDANQTNRMKDRDLRVLGLEPERVRRWFNKNYGMTFQAFMRAKRLGTALRNIKAGEKIAQTAFDNGYESLSGFNEAFSKIIGISPKKSGETQVIYLERINTPLGQMIAGATDSSLVLLEFNDRRMLETQIKKLRSLFNATFLPGSNNILKKTVKELTEYFKGKRRKFTIPLFSPATLFHQKVWEELKSIPYADTRSYADIACAIGQPTAVRAVANANGYNRIAIIIPCHRVIGSNGTLTGYGGGLWRKKWLLELEKNNQSVRFA